MKKRQKPTLLIAILGTFGVLALGINGLQSGLFRLPAPNQQQPEAVGEQRTNTPSAETVANNSKQAVNELKKAPDPQTKMAAEFKKSLGGKPLMAMSKNTPPAPKPSETSIATQWYRDNTYNKQKSGN